MKNKNLLFFIFISLILGTLLFIKPMVFGNKNHQCPISRPMGNKEYFSQFYEDYVLAYVFQNTEKGLFVDVGVNDPIIHNATHYFHQKGWHGINIEPNKELFNQILKARPDDINVNKAATNYKGSAKFYIPGLGSGIASLNEKILQIRGGQNDRTINVETDNLNNILKEHSVTDIDFIKIDVEGAESKVIEGLDLKKYRPKILVLESESPYRSLRILNLRRSYC